MPENNAARQPYEAEGGASAAQKLPPIDLKRSTELSEEERPCHEALVSALRVTAYGAWGVEAEDREATDLRQTLKCGLSEEGRAQLLRSISGRESALKGAPPESLHLHRRWLGDVYCGLGIAYGGVWFKHALYQYELALRGEAGDALRAVAFNNLAATLFWFERWLVASGEVINSDRIDRGLDCYASALSLHEGGSLEWGQTTFNLAREHCWLVAQTGRPESRNKALTYLRQLKASPKFSSELAGHFPTLERVPDLLEKLAGSRVVLHAEDYHYRYLLRTLTAGDVSDRVYATTTTSLHKCLALAVSDKFFNLELLYGHAHGRSFVTAGDRGASGEMLRGSAYGVLGVVKGPWAFEKSIQIYDGELARDGNDHLANNNKGTILGWYARGLCEDRDGAWVDTSKNALKHLRLALELRRGGAEDWALTIFNIATNSLFFALHTGDKGCAKNAVVRFSQLAQIVDRPGESWIGRAIGHHLKNDLRVAQALLSATEKAGPGGGEFGYRNHLKFDSDLEEHYEVSLYRYVVEKVDSIADESSSEIKVDVGDAFAGAVAALKARLIPTVTDHDIAQLEAVIREAQQNTPADKVGFVRDMRRMLEAGGLNLEIDGVDAAVNLSVRNGSLAFVVARQGGRSFKNTEVRVVRTDAPEFAPRPPRGALDTTTEPS